MQKRRPGAAALGGQIVLVFEIVAQAQPAGDHAQAPVAQRERGGGLGIRADLQVLVQKYLPLFLRVRRHENPGFRLRAFGKGVGRARRLCLYQRAGVRQPRRYAQQHRYLMRLRIIEGGARHIVCLLLIRRLEAGNSREIGQHPRILFVLARMHPRIIGHHHHESAVDTNQRRIGEGIHRHV